jgi:hypothetical protein
LNAKQRTSAIDDVLQIVQQVAGTTTAGSKRTHHIRIKAMLKHGRELILEQAMLKNRAEHRAHGAEATLTFAFANSRDGSLR